MERFRRGPEVMAVVLTGVFGEEEDFVPAPGKWSIRQVVAEDNPTLIAFDQDAWARNLDYGRRKPKVSLETFRRIRGENHELLNGLPESTFERSGNHSERGPVTLRSLVETAAAHAESHARQAQAIREAYKEAKGKR